MVITRALSVLALPLTALAFLAAAGCTSTVIEHVASGAGDAGDADGGGDEAAAPIPDSTAVAAIPLHSCLPSSYTMTATIGTQSFDLSIDTGSTTLGVASAKCTQCTDVSPLYTPGPSAVDEGQMADSQYASGSWTGEIYQDGVVLGKVPSITMNLVAIDTQMQFFGPQFCNSTSGGVQGIIGLAPAGDALDGTNGYFDRFVSTQKAPNIFATELCNSGGTLWLGGYDSTFTTAAPQYTPMLSDLADQSYAVNLVSVTVDGQTAAVASSKYPDSIVDTGTSIFILPSAAYTTITKAIAANAGFQKLFPGETAAYFSNPGNCKKVSGTAADIDAALPPMTLTLGTTDPITIQAAPTESYLVSYNGSWCPGLDSMNPTPGFPASSIMGAPILRSNIVIFDRDAKRIGFAPHTPCK
jgi:hypothetical protein